MKRKALFIGGTGTISSAITGLLANDDNWELWLLNRGNRGAEVPANVKTITADIGDEAAVLKLLGAMEFDVIADFIAFVPDHVKRDIRLFSGRTAQYIFISSASAYQKPLSRLPITESTPLLNPYWQYSRDKIACEEALMAAYSEHGFPITIVRPSHTYSSRSVPVSLHGANGSWQVLDRMRKGKPVIVPGDGSSLWTVTWNADFAKGFIGLMGNPHAMGEAVHITSDESLSWNDIYKSIAAALGVEAKLCHISTDFIVACDPSQEGPLLGDKSVSVIFDNSKLKRLVPGFNASTRFDQGVRIAVADILSDPAKRKSDPDFDAWCDRLAEAHQKGIATFQE